MDNRLVKDVSRRGQILAIQHLRGIAALLVVLFHGLAPVAWIYNPKPAVFNFAQGGVDIFFVISGCVMYVAARSEGVGEFISKRLLRVVPLYWLVTLAFVAMRMEHWGEPGQDFASLLCSLFFIPYSTPQGHPWPILVPGWSLNVEIFFYGLFAIGLAVKRPGRISSVLVILCVVAGLLFQPQAAALTLYTSPILLDFVAGLWLGALFVKARLHRWLWPALPVGIVALTCSDVAAPHEALARAIGGILIVTGAVSLEAAGNVWRSKLLNMLGNASYALYLVHTPVLLIVRAAFRRVPLSGWTQLTAFITIAVVGSIASALVLHYGIERPLLRRVSHRGRRDDPLAVETGHQTVLTTSNTVAATLPRVSQ